jgi:aminopeptidase N
MHDSSPVTSRRLGGQRTCAATLCLLFATVLACAAAVATRADVKATSYDIRVRLAPETNGLNGQATLALRLESPDQARAQPVVDFALNRGLKIERITGSGAEVREYAPAPDAAAHGEQADPTSLLTVYRVVLGSASEEFSLTFDYGGKLIQDVQAGERPGEIHNKLMAAHVGTEGIYLVSSGGWHPLPYRGPDAPAEGELASYRLAVEPVEGMKLVASATFDEQSSEQTGQWVWHSKYPLDSLALVGGPHQVKERQVDDVRLALHYSQPEDAESRQVIERHTDLFLDAAESYLKRYQPLIGPYPFRQYTIVENFFSSGFAFPEFTLLNRRLFQMGPRALMHGYLDHEMLHSWWGNSIYVDPADGDWCEALASFGANYYGYVLDGDEPGARKYRRNACSSFSLLKPEEDKPLGTFGQEEGAGRNIGYQKGAMVFQMLLREIGPDRFWATMRRLTADYTGKFVNWRTLQTLFEEQSNRKLGPFFEQWVRRSGAPHLSLGGAVWRQEAALLDVTIEQAKPPFDLPVPLRVVYADGTSSDEVVEMDAAAATASLSARSRPVSVMLDPDYQVFRELEPQEIVPTSHTTLAGARLLVVKSGDDVSKFYQRVIDRFSDRMGAEHVTQRDVADLTTEEPLSKSVLVLGEAVHAPQVQALLARTNCPITWQKTGFSIEGVSYDAPGHSVLCTVHHPDVAAGGVTVYYGNSEDALGRSDLLLFYRNSLVVFETQAAVVGGEKKYESQVILRRDFESPVSIEVRG